ncbi:MAG: hypothetical protein JSR33_11045 [Proteobacteria bacterium]|nr:hypothetical protein [Pseudomonadota bacterium]
MASIKTKDNPENCPVNPQLNQIARQEVAEVAGHSRPSIAGAHLGSNYVNS